MLCEIEKRNMRKNTQIDKGKVRVKKRDRKKKKR